MHVALASASGCRSAPCAAGRPGPPRSRGRTTEPCAVASGRNCPARYRHARRNARARAGRCRFASARSSGSVIAVVAAERDQMRDTAPPAPRSAPGSWRCRRARCAKSPISASRQRRRIDPVQSDDRRRPACGWPAGSPPGRSARRRGWWCRYRTECRRCRSARRIAARDAEKARRNGEGGDAGHDLTESPARTGRPRPRPRRSSGRAASPTAAAVIDWVSKMRLLVS